jgi:hypothetical protein
MSDRDFILANYNSFLDNVILNKDPEFWSGHFTGDDDDAGYLMDSLSHDVKAWRRRLETEADRCEVVEVSMLGDPVDSERWYDAVDRDEAYQAEQDFGSRQPGGW